MFDDTKLRRYPPFAESLQGLQGKNGKGELLFGENDSPCPGYI